MDGRGIGRDFRSFTLEKAQGRCTVTVCLTPLKETFYNRPVAYQSNADPAQVVRTDHDQLAEAHPPA